MKYLLRYRKRLLIIACFSYAYTSLEYGVHALKKHALISKRLRYIKTKIHLLVYFKFDLTN